MHRCLGAFLEAATLSRRSGHTSHTGPASGGGEDDGAAAGTGAGLVPAAAAEEAAATATATTASPGGDDSEAENRVPPDEPACIDAAAMPKAILPAAKVTKLAFGQGGLVLVDRAAEEMQVAIPVCDGRL